MWCTFVSLAFLFAGFLCQTESLIPLQDAWKDSDFKERIFAIKLAIGNPSREYLLAIAFDLDKIYLKENLYQVSRSWFNQDGYGRDIVRLPGQPNYAMKISDGYYDGGWNEEIKQRMADLPRALTGIFGISKTSEFWLVNPRVRISKEGMRLFHGGSSVRTQGTPCMAPGDPLNGHFCLLPGNASQFCSSDYECPLSLMHLKEFSVSVDMTATPASIYLAADSSASFEVDKWIYFYVMIVVFLCSVVFLLNDEKKTEQNPKYFVKINKDSFGWESQVIALVTLISGYATYFFWAGVVEVRDHYTAVFVVAVIGQVLGTLGTLQYSLTILVMLVDKRTRASGSSFYSLDSHKIFMLMTLISSVLISTPAVNVLMILIASSGIFVFPLYLSTMLGFRALQIVKSKNPGKPPHYPFVATNLYVDGISYVTVLLFYIAYTSICVWKIFNPFLESEVEIVSNANAVTVASLTWTYMIIQTAWYFARIQIQKVLVYREYKANLAASKAKKK